MASFPTARLRQLEQRQLQIQQEHRQLQQKHHALRQQHQQQTRHIQRVSKRIAQRSMVAIGRNLAAAPLEAVPVLGWLALAGGVALDVHDACSDLADLEQELPPGCAWATDSPASRDAEESGEP
jgi:hypothetical protein